MNLPLFIRLGKTPDEVEKRWRDSIRRDKHITPSKKTIAVILFTHELSGAVGVMYAALYMQHQQEYELALNLMGWKWNRSFTCPTPHFKLEDV